MVERDHMRYARRFDRIEHRLGLSAGAGERLFANDVLACIGCGDCDFRVAVVRRHDVDDVDVLAGDDGLPVR